LIEREQRCIFGLDPVDRAPSSSKEVDVSDETIRQMRTRHK
jgi:hypothetical protein